MLLLLMTCETGIQAGDPELLPPPSAGESDTVLNLTEETNTFYNVDVGIPF